jgi:hypothetical protein
VEHYETVATKFTNRSAAAAGLALPTAVPSASHPLPPYIASTPIVLYLLQSFWLLLICLLIYANQINKKTTFPQKQKSKN